MVNIIKLIKSAKIINSNICHISYCMELIYDRIYSIITKSFFNLIPIS